MSRPSQSCRRQIKIGKTRLQTDMAIMRLAIRFLEEAFGFSVEFGIIVRAAHVRHTLYSPTYVCTKTYQSLYAVISLNKCPRNISTVLYERHSDHS